MIGNFTKKVKYAADRNTTRKGMNLPMYPIVPEGSYIALPSRKYKEDPKSETLPMSTLDPSFNFV